MKIINALAIVFILCFVTQVVSAQELLTKEAAVQKALENSFGVKLSQNATTIAQNNTSKNNTGKLPSISLTGGYNFNLDNTSANFQDGRNTTLTLAPSQGLNASIGADYVLYDGFFRRYNTAQLEERYQLSKLELEATMENIAAQTLSQYYQIATLSENMKVLTSAIEISEERRTRATTRLEYGQGSPLDILNAEVDLNNDSLNYINTELQLTNAKRLLNNLMVEKEAIDYQIDPSADFLFGLDKVTLKEKAMSENIAIAQIDRNIQIGNIAIDMAEARKLPVVGVGLSYGYAYSKNNPASFLASISNNGLNAGLSVSWNIFDGGATKHSLQTAELNNIQLSLQKEQLLDNIAFEFDNAWANYENRKLIYQTQSKNVTISEENFKRSQERFNAGQINSVDFRQAQLNLLNAEISLINAKYQVKISEIELLLLSGQILD